MQYENIRICRYYDDAFTTEVVTNSSFGIARFQGVTSKTGNQYIRLPQNFTKDSLGRKQIA